MARRRAREAAAEGGWERHPDGSYISIPVRRHEIDDVRAWCCENCVGDFLIVLGPKIVFERGEGAALATVFLRAEER